MSTTPPTRRPVGSDVIALPREELETRSRVIMRENVHSLCTGDDGHSHTDGNTASTQVTD